MYALIVLAVIAGLYLTFRWIVTQPRKTRLQLLAVIASVTLIGLAATGRLNWVFAVVGALLPFLRRSLSLLMYAPTLRRMYGRFRSSQSKADPSASRGPAIETRFLRITLDDNTGAMDGSVRAGRFSGKQLTELTPGQLLELLAECSREDEASAALLRAYLDRVDGNGSKARDQADTDSNSPGFSGTMTHREAYDILGLEENAGEEAVIDAHRRLMQKIHPDRGGSTFLAAKINQAKATLLSRH